MPDLLVFVLLAAAAGLGLALLELMIRDEIVVAMLLLGVVVWGAAWTGHEPGLTLLGNRVFASDLVLVLVAAAAVARYLRLRQLALEQRLLVVLGLVTVFSLLRGIADGDLAGAANDFRGYLRFVGPALYFSTVSLSRRNLEQIGRVWLGAAGAVAVLVSLRWASRMTALDLGPLQATYDAAIRVLSGTDTFFLAHAALIAVLPSLSRQRTPPLQRGFAVLLLVMVIFLNRRTVWAALVIAVVTVVLRDPRLGRRVAVASAAGAVLLVVLLPYLPGAVGDDRPTAQSATDVGTLLWRVEGWVDLVEEGPSTPVEVLFGQPFGSGFERQVAGRTLESTPHSFYVQTFLRIGVVGLLCMLAIATSALAVLLRRNQPSDVGLLSRDTLLVLLVTQLAWFVTWPPGGEQGLVFGLAAATAARQRRGRPDAPTVAALNAARNGAHRGETPSARTSGNWKSARTSRAPARSARRR